MNVALDTKSDERKPIDLDGLYDARELAPWIRLTARVILEQARLNRIPAVRINQRVLRFHPRSILLARGGAL